jgi:hypothetical protein
MHAQQPAWGRSREFEITTRSAGRFALTQSTTGDLEDDEASPEEDQLVHGRKKRKVAFMPSLSRSHFPFATYNICQLSSIFRHDSHNLLPWTLAQGEYLSSQYIDASEVISLLTPSFQVTRTQRFGSYGGHCQELKVRSVIHLFYTRFQLRLIGYKKCRGKEQHGVEEG